MFSSQSHRLTRPTLGVVIRFKDSEATLPAVLEALGRQTVRPDVVVGVDNRSSDTSAEIMRAAGAKVVGWVEAYNHPRVLNFALRHCPTDLVLVLSSHTVLGASDVIEKLVAAMADPRTACASGKWDADAFYSDAIDWSELKSKGLKFCSIYSNSMGMFRRSLWEQTPFDETLPTLEDGAWALEQVRKGHICRRLDFPFTYRRGGGTRAYIFAVITFQLAHRHGLRVAWLGVAATLRHVGREAVRQLAGRGAVGLPGIGILWGRLRAWCLWRFVRPVQE